MIMPGTDGERMLVSVDNLKPGDYIPRAGWIRRTKVNRRGTHVIVYYMSNKATGFPIGEFVTIVRRQDNVDQ